MVFLGIRMQTMDQVGKMIVLSIRIPLGVLLLKGVVLFWRPLPLNPEPKP